MGQSASLIEANRLHEMPISQYIFKERLNSALSIWRSRSPQLDQLLQHRIVINTEHDLQQIYEMFKIRHSHLYLAPTRYLTCEEQGVKGCGGFYKGRVYFDYPIASLSLINDIPFIDSLHLLAVALKGFEILYRKFGYFEIFQDMFHIFQTGKLKVWCNNRVEQLGPEQYILDPTGREEDFILRIINLIDNNVDPSQQLNLKRELYRKIPQGKHFIAFAQINSVFRQICKQNNWQPPERLKCIAELTKSDVQKLLKNQTQNFNNNSNKQFSYEPTVTMHTLNQNTSHKDEQQYLDQGMTSFRANTFHQNQGLQGSFSPDFGQNNQNKSLLIPKMQVQQNYSMPFLSSPIKNLVQVPQIQSVRNQIPPSPFHKPIVIIPPSPKPHFVSSPINRNYRPYSFTKTIQNPYTYHHHHMPTPPKTRYFPNSNSSSSFMGFPGSVSVSQIQNKFYQNSNRTKVSSPEIRINYQSKQKVINQKVNFQKGAIVRNYNIPTQKRLQNNTYSSKNQRQVSDVSILQQKNIYETNKSKLPKDYFRKDDSKTQQSVLNSYIISDGQIATDQDFKIKTQFQPLTTNKSEEWENLKSDKSEIRRETSYNFTQHIQISKQFLGKCQQNYKRTQRSSRESESKLKSSEYTDPKLFQILASRETSKVSISPNYRKQPKKQSINPFLLASDQNQLFFSFKPTQKSPEREQKQKKKYHPKLDQQVWKDLQQLRHKNN